MLVDWFTVGAQAFNFVILVWLMKRFLYKPILRAVDAREKGIATELARAAAKEAEARRASDQLQRKNEDFDRQRATLVGQATDEARVEGQRLLDEARRAADALSAKRREMLRDDAQNLNQAIVRRTQEEVFAIARKALMDLATTSLEERMGDVFTRRLRQMDDQAKTCMGEALGRTTEPAIVRSAFDLPAEQRATIQNALNEVFSSEVRLRFETAPDVVSGIELAATGQKVTWTISDYLAKLEEGVAALLTEENGARAGSKPGSSAPEAKAR